MGEGEEGVFEADVAGREFDAPADVRVAVGRDEGPQKDITPCSKAARCDSECSEAEGETETHDETEERHLGFCYLHEIR